ncbi:MAG: nitrilase-related carbon-nitrogen hydrolase [Candidatus Thermoplasmatota archaeon]|nr:nitrilase-related carbon-nitrogen hydrolase [Candidatus Thermoplasmatota archaeon]
MKGSDIMGGKWNDPISACAVQPRLHLGDVDRNLHGALDLVKRASESGSVDLFVLPEVFTTGFPYKDLPRLSERSDEVIGVLSDAARDLGSHLMFTQVVEDNGSFFNRCFVIGAKGETLLEYDKTHLFSRADEHLFFTAGSDHTSFEIKGARISPLICYELRFPELSRRNVVDGSHILIYMGQWPMFRIFQWDALLLARAIENQCYVIASGAYGPHGRENMGGHSQIISPFGNMIGDIVEKEGFTSAVMDPEEMKKFRERIPVLVERRPDLY